MKTTPITLLLCLFCTLSFSGQSKAQKLYADLGLNSQYFNYEEQNNEGVMLNREEGYLNGGTIAIGYKPTMDTEWRLSHERLYGSVDYDGLTQNGSMLHTQTEEEISLFSIRFKQSLGEVYGIPGLNWFVSTALNHRHWDRDIQATSMSLGLSENYSWNEFDLSIEANYKLSSKNIMIAQIGFAIGFNEKIEVDLHKIGAGKPSFNLGDIKGKHVNFGYQRLLGDASSLSVSLTYQYWHFDRSGDHSITTGPRRITISEPESDTHQAGIYMQYRSAF